MEQLLSLTDQLTKAIQDTIKEKVAKTKPRPDAKRWWNSDLRKRKKDLNRLRAQSYRYRALADHPSYAELKAKNTQYGNAIIQAKRQHWINYLEEMTTAYGWLTNTSKNLREMEDPSSKDQKQRRGQTTDQR